MEKKKELYDGLCDRLRPYITSALDELPAEMRAENNDIFSTGAPEALRELEITIATQIVTSSLIDVLYWASKECDSVTLRDCLLPEDLGEMKEAWEKDLGLTGFSTARVEELLRTFGQEQISDCLEVPVAGYIIKDEQGFALYKSKPED